MSIINSGETKLYHFFRSGPTPCPYLPGRIERKLFTRLTDQDLTKLNDQLCGSGFRRSHDIVYRPVCPGCTACVPVRIKAQEFFWSRSMRRIVSRNNDLQLSESKAVATTEQFSLFSRYQSSRHSDSDMSRMGANDYAAMIEEGAATARLFNLRTRDGVLVGSILADRLADGFSAVYSFFEPEFDRRSLGTFLILDLVRLARAEGRRYVYLGYWISGSPKMDYKMRFRPVERLTPAGWVLCDEAGPNATIDRTA
ncbi:MAG: arginyltransferase [Pseudomonadota bacterium]